MEDSDRRVGRVRPSDRGLRDQDAVIAHDRDLVARVVAELPRGTEAFRELVSTYTSIVRARALRLVGDESDADEVVQDVFMRVFRGIASFTVDKPLKHWIYTITSNSAKNLLRSRARERRRVVEYSRYASDSAVTFQSETMVAPLDAALEHLDPTTRIAIILRYVEGASFPEIARDLELGESAVKMKVKRGLARLRAQLEMRSDTQGVPVG